jgi:homoserine kinase type II
MAVYTKLNFKEVNNFLKQYGIDDLKNFRGILQGVENTNYYIRTNSNEFILTIYEKRVDPKDLPFFLRLLTNLSKNNFISPKPLENLKNYTITKIKNKNATLVTFLKGKSKTKLTNNDCFEVGKVCAQLHNLTKKFEISRKNNLSINNWEKIFKKINKKKLKKTSKEKIDNYLFLLKKNWPKKLPKGIIHADLFPDNIFFINKKISGVIDFYFACNDFFAYEIAICLNSLCFNNNSTFNIKKSKNLIKGYETIRKLTTKEKYFLPILAMGAAMRFFLTRLYDAHNTDKNASVKIKDPNEYLKKLEFHSKIRNFKEYFI